MEHHNILEILRDAMDLEREGAKFYNKAAKHSKSELVKDIFKRFAQDEMNHFDKLEMLFDEYCENNEWMVEADVAKSPDKELETSNVFDDRKLDAEFNELEAVEIALKAEHESMELYRTALNECGQEFDAGCALFKWLIDFEKQHIAELKKLKSELLKKH
ncbi:MAG: ferritin family protein [Candidatus Altiarchaeota archaeon]|nr:ferritin family protein [Candidatus Altiarchaeota archaeon]